MQGSPSLNDFEMREVVWPWR